MKHFVELDVSFFSEEFTLNPYPFLAPLYERDDILGFSSQGMNFVFRFEHARAIMFNKSFMRGLDVDPSSVDRETRYAGLYPNRARQFQHNFNSGAPNLKFKALIVRFIADIAQNASFEAVDPIFSRLADGGQLDNYVDDVSTLALRIFFITAGISFSEKDLSRMYWAGYRFLNALENMEDETLIADSDAAIAEVWTFVEQRFDTFDSDSLIAKFIADGRAINLSDDELIANIAAFFIVALANTIGISSAYLLRNTIRFPEARALLKSRPELLQSDNTIIEFLRLDNHVKSLSRHATENITIDKWKIEKGENINLFFPGVNLDPRHWHNPLALDFSRSFENENNIVFGGSIFMCVGRRLGIAFMKQMLSGFLRYLPESAHVVENDIVMDGSWVAERIITKMPIVLS